MASLVASWSKLAKAWCQDLATKEIPYPRRVVEASISRTLPLLEDPTSVPFVCRYRADTIAPLSTTQVHQLSEKYQKYRTLSSLRKRILEKLPDEREDIRNRVLTSTSKSELETIYLPYKPLAKGTLEERYQRENPELCARIDALWEGTDSRGCSFEPRKAAVSLLGSRIAHQTFIGDALYEAVTRTCQVESKLTKESEGSSKDYRAYDSFSGVVQNLRDHQVLAIRRGADQKCLTLKFVLDSERMEETIRYGLRRNGIDPSKQGRLWKEAIHDAWTRLLRRQCTNRLWRNKCKEAEARAIEVFCQNLSRALLAPPCEPSTRILAMDPGLKAGIKCALLKSDGSVVDHRLAFCTLHFLGRERDRAKKQLSELLLLGQETPESRLVVALGNGHGTNEARALLDETVMSLTLEVEVKLVNEAGASVWSVTECAKKEFPDHPPTAVAAASIGRRLLNPLYELVKIPPKSLGLGMYQHDLSEKELDDKLHLTSVDAVAAVGVDGNSCSYELLQKVPGVNKTIAQRIIDARPLRSRAGLKKIKGLGGKTFENCAGFIRVRGKEELDNTLVHPESYKLARWLLQKHDLKLSKKNNTSGSSALLPSIDSNSWISEAAKKFSVSDGRVQTVADHLYKSITNHDPRLERSESSSQTRIGSVDGCSRLQDELRENNALRGACPVRRVVAIVRNVVDFGVFVDIGVENDALVHRSKLGDVEPRSLMIGQEVGVDVLEVRPDGKMSGSLTGLNCPPPQKRNGAKRPPPRTTDRKTKRVRR